MEAPGTDLQELLLRLAHLRTVPEVLECIVSTLAAREGTALVRIWQMLPGDICAGCSMSEECDNRERCLHLVASCGTSRDGDSWDGLQGRFRRFPVGVRKVGRIAATGDEFTLRDLDAGSEWIADPAWVKREGIRGFIGKPLTFQGETLGVLAVFLRGNPDDRECLAMRMVADHAAASLASARAFEEITALKSQLADENAYLREEVREVTSMGGLVGDSPALRTVLQQLELVAPTDAAVLIHGESGTGKELIAREIHERSARVAGPLVKVNCAAIPRDLFESEFFGHVKGAFTGATADRKGRFELAHGGTLFLDEVGETPLDLQGKLLRVLQEGQLEPVGSSRTRQVDVRVVAATNRDLRRAVEDGTFRQDLYYRLNVFPLEVAPLRQRKEDIGPLARHFVGVASKRMNVPARRITSGNVVALQAYDWPGNVRELQNVIERALIISQGSALELDLPGRRQRAARPVARTDSQVVRTDQQMRALERENLVAALEQVDWRVSGEGGAAQLLGIPPTTLASRMKKLGIHR